MPGAWDFEVTSCFRPSSTQPWPPHASHPKPRRIRPRHSLPMPRPRHLRHASRLRKTCAFRFLEFRALDTRFWCVQWRELTSESCILLMLLPQVSSTSSACAAGSRLVFWCIESTIKTWCSSQKHVVVVSIHGRLLWSWMRPQLSRDIHVPPCQDDPGLWQSSWP